MNNIYKMQTNDLKVLLMSAYYKGDESLIKEIECIIDARAHRANTGKTGGNYSYQ